MKWKLWCSAKNRNAFYCDQRWNNVAAESNWEINENKKLFECVVVECIWIV
jgi:hypothetical protein